MTPEFNYLRPMVESDLSWVLSIEKQAYDYPWTRSGFENSLDQGVNYILCSDAGRELGYACVLTVLDEAHLLNLCIAPDYQGLGVGRQALEKLKEKLKESAYQMMFLEVRDSNIPAQRLYEKCGFQRDGLRKNYYRCRSWDEEREALLEDKEDAVLMSCPL